MITFDNQIFHLSTKDTSYLIRVLEEGFLEHLYYGTRIKQAGNYIALYEKFGCGYGNINVMPSSPKLGLDNICLEYSSQTGADFRHSPIQLQMPDHSFANDFRYQDYQIYDGTYLENERTAMPYGKQNLKTQEGYVQTLDITLCDMLFSVKLHLIYTVFYDSNVITRRVKIENNEDSMIALHRLMSMQLDIPQKDYTLHTFDGLWARERKENQKDLVSGIYVTDSTTGSSSNRHNPFILLSKKDCTEQVGECFGINLVYSGNHYEAVEVSEYGKIRIVNGINPYQFAFELSKNEAFYTPESVLSFSNRGKNGLSQNMHHFILNHIVSSDWAFKERPVLINNWEGTYFDFNESKLLSIAAQAKKLGIELFVLDDGWFGKRNDDTSSLGDWTVNEKKLGGSLKKLAEKINNIGLKFGLWFEPEMVNQDSKLYEKHPDWAVRVPNRTLYLGRNQMVLDLTNPDVRDYLVEAVSKVLLEAPIDYVKWDMNRHLSDAFSVTLGTKQGEFFHRFILGVYDVMKRITEAFPHVLFESCSSGGNRFDLGILAYMPQTWTSDNTDANERITIQEGTSYGYPLSTMGAHVSVAPNHQTLRYTSLETRFNVACFGLLGYELDITKLTKAEKKVVREQVAFYKKYRSLFQFGTFYRMDAPTNRVRWQVISNDKKHSIILNYQRLAEPNTGSDIIRAYDIDEELEYVFTPRKQFVSIKQFGNLINHISPVAIKEEGVLQSVINKVYMLESEKESYMVYGDLLMNAGIKLTQQFVGTGYNEEIRVMGDFSSRLYLIEEKDCNNRMVDEVIS